MVKYVITKIVDYEEGKKFTVYWVGEKPNTIIECIFGILLFCITPYSKYRECFKTLNKARKCLHLMKINKWNVEITEREVNECHTI